MNAHVHPIFQRLFADFGDHGLLPGDEQRAGETLSPSTTPRANTLVATPIPHLYGHEGVEL